MRGLQEAQAAVFDKGDIAPLQFDLQRVAVVGRAEQHGLLPERNPSLALFENSVCDPVHLRVLVGHCDQTGSGATPPAGEEILGEALLGQPNHCIGRVQDRLGRPVVLLQGQHRGRRVILLGKIQDVAHSGRAESVNRLCIVAHHCDPVAARLEPPQNLGLQAVGVLVLVDQHLVEASADLLGNRRIAQQVQPVKQEIVIVEHLPLDLGVDVGGK